MFVNVLTFRDDDTMTFQIDEHFTDHHHLDGRYILCACFPFFWFFDLSELITFLGLSFFTQFIRTFLIALFTVDFVIALEIHWDLKDIPTFERFFDQRSNINIFDILIHYQQTHILKNSER